MLGRQDSSGSGAGTAGGGSSGVFDGGGGGSSVLASLSRERVEIAGRRADQVVDDAARHVCLNFPSEWAVNSMHDTLKLQVQTTGITPLVLLLLCAGRERAPRPSPPRPPGRPDGGPVVKVI